MEKGMALRQDYHHLTPFEANLGWSVHLDKKGDFVGRAALEKLRKLARAMRSLALRLSARAMRTYARTR